ncbi:tripartite tricarboxylate transporter substrate binding protein [Rhodovarius crocodyli]|uniref:Tripartite tricarboxylate transporter substrate binding protein n=1 Tax=Rhodovarius crocodyli TaxID=1979269 RepID=A0A437MJL2_9PROT|nr:tripartite tricarboxylate transporter substrate binding protein [Rhodovarius crocodyli]RVT97848.1 tripartite tricarboxylate transporter substrate binding protein [Rhodovarius crocodyli]
MLMNRRRFTLSTMALPGLAPGLAAAQAFPNRPITIQISFPAGGATDVQMRSFAEAATRAFGQTVIIENRPGAGGTLPATNMRNTRPDGYTLAQFALPAIRLPFMQRMAFNPRTDFTPVIHLTGYLFMVCVRNESPYRSWGDLLADMRRRPGEVKLGNTGANGTPHLTLIELAEKENVQPLHVPFRGEGDAVPSLIGGHIDASATGSGVLQMIQDGQLRALNVWSRNRSPKLPEVPTLGELGYRDMVVTSPYGLVGPQGMEPAIVRALHDGFRTALNDPAHIATLARLDMPLEYLDSDSYASFIQRTADQEEQRVRRLGLATG